MVESKIWVAPALQQLQPRPFLGGAPPTPLAPRVSLLTDPYPSYCNIALDIVWHLYTLIALRYIKSEF